MSNDFTTTYDAALPAQTEITFSSRSIHDQKQPSDALLLNSVLEGGPIPHTVTIEKKSMFSKKMWQRISSQVASVF